MVGAEAAGNWCVSSEDAASHGLLRTVSAALRVGDRETVREGEQEPAEAQPRTLGGAGPDLAWWAGRPVGGASRLRSCQSL